MVVQYSPVCDKNLVAYLAYLSVSVYNGQCSDDIGGGGGDRGRNTGGSCGSHDAGTVGGVFAGFCDEARNAGLDVAYARGIEYYGCRVDRDVGDGHVAGACEAPGLGDSDAGGGGRGVDDCVGDGSVDALHESPAVPGQVLSGSGEPQVVRGVHYERNRRRKELKRERKVRGGETRVSGSGARPVVGKGFFSGCSEVVRAELQASRARRLVAENLAAEAEAARKHRYLTSVAAYVQDFSKGMNAAKQLVKATKDTEVGGWAETVSGSVAESLARAAPSSVPSLDSVRLGSSSLESSSGVAVVTRQEARLEEFRGKEAAMQSEFDALEMVSFDDVDAAMSALRAEYADVLFSPKELAVKEVEKKVVDGVICMDLTMEQKMKIVELVTL